MRHLPAGSGAAAVGGKRKPTTSRFFDLAAAVAGVRMPEEVARPRQPSVPRNHPPRPPVGLPVKQVVAAATRGSLTPRCPTRTPSPSKTPAPIRKRSVSCAKAAIQQCSPREEGCHEAEDDEVELDFSPQPGDGSPLFVPCQQQQTDAGSTGSGRRAEPRGQRFAEAWLRLARIVLLELGTRGPEPPAAVRSSFHAGREAHSRQQALAGPEEVDETAEDASTDWRSDRVCLSYLLEQSVTWIEPESDEDDFHSPKASLQKPPDEEDEEEAHPAMKAIARQQRAPGIVEGLPKCLSI